MAHENSAATTSFLYRVLGSIEAAGNKLPHPTLLFIWMAGAVLVVSWLLSALKASALHPVSGESITAINLLSAHGIRRMLAGTVTNFTGFAPLGTVLVAMMGIGVAERSGLLAALLRRLVSAAPARLLTFFVVLAGVMSSLAADAGYVVLIPLAGILFASAGRHPVAGIAAAFAGVSGGFSANLLIGPLDAILAGLSTSAAQLVVPNYEVSAAANYYFIIVSTLLIGLVGTFVTERIVERRLPEWHDDAEAQETPDAEDGRALKMVLLWTLAFVAVCLYGLIPEGGFLRDPATGSVVRSPFVAGSVVVVTVWVGISGVIFGRVSGRFDSEGSSVVVAMEETMETMAGYLVLMFFAAQFVAWFGWTNLGIIAAIQGSELLRALELDSIGLLLAFILLAGSINLFVGSASAKWAIMAPVFVPMLMLLGISPAATQMAYRIGDSTTNIVTPLMPYLALVVSFVQRYDRQAGVGSVVAMMVPYSVALLLCWGILLAFWMGFDLPLGPGAGFTYSINAIAP